MKGQVHLLDTDESLTEGKTYKANCQKEVPNAVFAFMWNESLTVGPGVFMGMIESAISSFRVCHKCMNHPRPGRYVYGLANGEEIKHPEAA